MSEKLLKEIGDFLLALADRKGKSLFLSSRDLKQWSEPLILALKQHQILKKATLPKQVTCSGCEEYCGGMDVYSQTKRSGEIVSFVICDKRDDTNRVILEGDELEWWEISLADVTHFLREKLF